MKRGDQVEQFGGRTAFGDHQHRVARLAYTKIAVSGFGGVQKDRGRSGALERRGNLASDVTGFA